ncbi:olfactory receptor 6C65-like [Rana temporaria]|uniref:olfactory receptor 6C65-like n=1 Tax=Rana temporaria TaxID=8407 RepID=UPI001AACCC22|nr:olfactory receptor 6C65-like [Rana temporaria]
MAPKGSGTAKNAKKQKGSPSGSEDLGHTSMVPYSPEIPGVIASTLGGLEQRLTALIAASLPDRKRARSPSPRSQSLGPMNFPTEGDFLEDQADEELERSDSEESTIEEPFSASQAEKLWIQSLTDMVRSAFKLPLPEPAVNAVSSLGSSKAPQSGFIFPVHPLLEDLIYQDWDSGRKQAGDSGNPRLAPQDMVHPHCKDGDRRTLDAPAPARPTFTGSDLPPFFTVAKFDGLAIESYILSLRIIHKTEHRERPLPEHGGPWNTENETFRVITPIIVFPGRMMVYPENCTAITEIQLTAFTAFEGFRIPMFVLFLIIYILICSENVLIVYIIFSSANLKALMFFIIQSMCIYDLISITNIIPKFLNDVLHERPTFTVAGCILQSQMFATTGDVGCFHYVLMSYDRYLAVCHPLRYFSFVNNRIYFWAVIASWIISASFTSVISGLLSQLQYCGHNTIHNFFCDPSPLMDLAISDTTHIRFFIAVISFFMLLVTSLSVFVTYVFIIQTVLKIPSSTGRKKTFSTCSSHLIVFSMQSGLSLGVYALPAKVVTQQFSNTFTFIFFFWTPLVNPLIYTFNNKEFRAECLKKIRSVNKKF